MTVDVQAAARRIGRRRGTLPSAAGVVRALFLAGAMVTVPGRAGGQADSVVVQLGPQYQAAAHHRWLLGTGYRPLWTAMVRVEVLDLGRFAGGLEPIEPGGGRQTRTLHMRGADGRRYVFRSVDKFVEQVLPADLRRTFVHDLFQDHMSALHPTGALAVPALLDAAGVLHVEPRLVVMPDDPRLGEHRSEFAGMPGQIEERPNEGPDATPGFAGSQRVVGMERLLERLDEDPEQVVAEREYLTARLVDFLIGDTDRGSDQWRWAGEDRSGGGVRFRPIPRDRDWAFIRSDALLSPLARAVFPKLLAYGPTYPSMTALTYSSRHRDRQLLTGLPLETWDSVARALRERVTDRVIDQAVAGTPSEHRALEADRLIDALRRRRDRLPEIAAEFYRFLAGEVDVRGTEAADVAAVELLSDGSVDVRVSAPASASRPFFRRRFRPGETREVRIYLLDGDDRAVVAGNGPTTITVRVIGGPGDDALADSSSAAAGAVALYDAEGDNEIIAGPGTRVDRDPFEPPGADDGWIASRVLRERFRDWGDGRAIRPVVGYGEGAGVIVGAGLTRTRYGFRRTPHARRLWIEGKYALRSGGFGLAAGWHRPWENSPWSARVVADAAQFDAIRFYGFGNDSPGPGVDVDHDRALVMQDRASITPALAMEPSPATRLDLGVRAKYVDPRPATASPLATSGAFGSNAYESLGGWIAWTLDRAPDDGRQGTGFRLHGGAAIHPPMARTPDWFGVTEAEARAYLDVGPTLAFRTGGKKAWGAFPVQEAAFLGGKSSLRGFRYNRFAGDGALYGSAEARAPLGRLLLLVRGDLGAFGFVDTGRVFLDGASPGGWHTGYGGGLTFTSLGTTVSATYGRGEEGRFYLDVGMPF